MIVSLEYQYNCRQLGYCLLTHGFDNPFVLMHEFDFQRFMRKLSMFSTPLRKAKKVKIDEPFQWARSHAKFQPRRTDVETVII